MAASRTVTRRAAAVAIAVAAALSAAALAAPPAARADTGVRYGLTDDAWIRDGPGTLEERLSKLNELGVQLVRFNVRWNEVARSEPGDARDPHDAAYDWSDDDAVVNGLRAHGIGVLLGLVGTPGWANGGLGPNYAPSSSRTFGDFATAAARHYPWVTRWLVWNEPNQQRWLRPTRPLVYVSRLLDPAYAAIHAAIRGAQVGGGVTAPRGSTGGVSPIDWIHGMHAAGARLDAYAHNPYPLNPKRESPRAGGCGHCKTITMATVGRLVTEVARNFGSARIWLTEYGYQTNPPDRLLGVSPGLQARYVGDAALQAYRTPRVDLLIQFLYRDEPDVARFQSGLVRLGNEPKPAYAAFQLPLAQVSRSGTRTTLWGELRAPAAGSQYRLQRLAGSRWVDLTPTLAARGGFFSYVGTLPKGTAVRVAAGPLVSPPLVVS